MSAAEVRSTIDVALINTTKEQLKGVPEFKYARTLETGGLKWTINKWPRR